MTQASAGVPPTSALPELDTGRAVNLVRAGVMDTLTFLPGILTLGTIFGASAVGTGISPVATVAMSAIVFSGSGQFASLPVWHGPGPLVALGTLALSLRFSLITASMGPHLARIPTWLKALIAFGITDENYALAVSRRGGVLEPAYLASSGGVLYVTWFAGTAIGATLGAQLLAGWAGPLSAVFPIVFITVTVLCCTSRPAAAVAILGAILGVAGALWLPAGWHVVVAGLLASLAGPALEGFFSRGRPDQGTGWSGTESDHSEAARPFHGQATKLDHAGADEWK